MRNWIYVAIFTLLLLIAWVTLPIQEWLHLLSITTKSWGATGVLVFIVIYAIATILFIPGAPMTIAAGGISGFWGIPIVLAGAMIGASACAISMTP